jgi:integration host factor subunit alpha
MEKTTTRSSLSEAVFKNVGLSRNESANLVDSIFNEILKNLTSGEEVKISSFGTFMVRDKKERIGRNPKTGQEVPITARQVVTFRASNVLKSKVDSKNKMNKKSEASSFANNERDFDVN